MLKGNTASSFALGSAFCGPVSVAQNLQIMVGFVAVYVGFLLVWLVFLFVCLFVGSDDVLFCLFDGVLAGSSFVEANISLI